MRDSLAASAHAFHAPARLHSPELLATTFASDQMILSRLPASYYNVQHIYAFFFGLNFSIMQREKYET